MQGIVVVVDVYATRVLEIRACWQFTVAWLCGILKQIWKIKSQFALVQFVCNLKLQLVSCAIWIRTDELKNLNDFAKSQNLIRVAGMNRRRIAPMEVDFKMRQIRWACRLLNWYKMQKRRACCCAEKRNRCADLIFYLPQLSQHFDSLICLTAKAKRLYFRRENFKVAFVYSNIACMFYVLFYVDISSARRIVLSDRVEWKLFRWVLLTGCDVVAE
jgi:hypothetical protein